MMSENGQTDEAAGVASNTGRQHGAVPPVCAMLVGAPKAGTTSLYRYAAQHPQLLSHAQREMMYFFSEDEYAQGYAECARKYLPERYPSESLFLAKHVFAMYKPDAIKRLHEHNPSVHVFALLRDPVKRAYSSFWYSRRRGWESAKSFGAAVQRELDQTISGDWLADRDRLHLKVGIYQPHIERLLEVFGPQRVHVFLTDDLAQDAGALCRTMYEAVGVDSGFEPDLSREHNAAAAARSELVARSMAGVLKSKSRMKRTARRFIPHGLARRARHALLRLNEKSFDPPPMPDDSRRRLIDYFAPHNETLSGLIGRDLSGWSDG